MGKSGNSKKAKSYVRTRGGITVRKKLDDRQAIHQSEAALLRLRLFASSSVAGSRIDAVVDALHRDGDYRIPHADDLRLKMASELLNNPGLFIDDLPRQFFGSDGITDYARALANAEHVYSDCSRIELMLMQSVLKRPIHLYNLVGQSVTRVEGPRKDDWARDWSFPKVINDSLPIRIQYDFTEHRSLKHYDSGKGKSKSSSNTTTTTSNTTTTTSNCSSGGRFILVPTSSGTLVIPFVLDDTINAIKERVHDATGYRTDRFSLKYESRFLESTATLRGLGFANSDNLIRLELDVPVLGGVVGSDEEHVDDEDEGGDEDEEYEPDLQLGIEASFADRCKRSSSAVSWTVNDDENDSGLAQYGGSISGGRSSGGKMDRSGTNLLESRYPMTTDMANHITELLNLDKSDCLELEKLAAEGLEYLGLDGEATEAIKEKYAHWTDAIASIISKVIPGGVLSINFGEGLQDGTKVLVIKHYAPESCRTYKCPLFKYNRMDPANPCISPFKGWLPRSLIHEAGGEPNEATAKLVSDGLTMVDSNITIPDDKDTVVEETLALCQSLGMSYPLLVIIGWINAAFHQMHYFSIAGEALPVVAASACTRDLFFGGHEPIQCQTGRYLGPLPHGQVFAMRLPLMNISVYPNKLLVQYNALLVTVYGIIGIPVPDVSTICHRVGERGDFAMTDQEIAELIEMIRQACIRGGIECGRIRTSAAAKAKAGLFDQMTVIEISLLFGSVSGGIKGGAVTGKIRTEAAKMMKAGREDELTPKQLALFRGCVAGGETTGKIRTEASELVKAGREDELNPKQLALYRGSITGGTNSQSARDSERTLVAQDIQKRYLDYCHHFSLSTSEAIAGTSYTVNTIRECYTKRTIHPTYVTLLRSSRFFEYCDINANDVTTQVTAMETQYQYGVPPLVVSVNKDTDKIKPYASAQSLPIKKLEKKFRSRKTDNPFNYKNGANDLQWRPQSGVDVTLAIKGDFCSYAPKYFSGDKIDMIDMAEGLSRLGHNKGAIDSTLLRLSSLDSSNEPTASATAASASSAPTVADSIEQDPTAMESNDSSSSTSSLSEYASAARAASASETTASGPTDMNIFPAHSDTSNSTAATTSSANVSSIDDEIEAKRERLRGMKAPLYDSDDDESNIPVHFNSASGPSWPMPIALKPAPTIMGDMIQEQTISDDAFLERPVVPRSHQSLVPARLELLTLHPEPLLPRDPGDPLQRRYGGRRDTMYVPGGGSLLDDYENINRDDGIPPWEQVSLSVHVDADVSNGQSDTDQSSTNASNAEAATAKPNANGKRQRGGVKSKKKPPTDVTNNQSMSAEGGEKQKVQKKKRRTTRSKSNKTTAEKLAYIIAHKSS